MFSSNARNHETAIMYAELEADRMAFLPLGELPWKPNSFSSTGSMSNHKSHLTIIAVCGSVSFSGQRVCVCVRTCSVFPFRIKPCCESHHGKAAVGAWVLSLKLGKGKLLRNWAWCLIEAFQAVIERVVFVHFGRFASTINKPGSDEVCVVA